MVGEAVTANEFFLRALAAFLPHFAAHALTPEEAATKAREAAEFTTKLYFKT